MQAKAKEISELTNLPLETVMQLVKAKQEHDSLENVYREYGLLEFLQKTFPDVTFSREDDQTNQRFCMRYLFCRKGPKANELERKLKFVVLYDTNKINLDDDLRTKLWCEVIQKYTAKWTNLIPAAQRLGWDVARDDNMVLINGETVELRLGTSETHVQALPIEYMERSVDSVYVLLVDDSVVSSNSKGNFCISKKDQETLSFYGKTEKPYHVHVSMDKDHINISWGELMTQTTHSATPGTPIDLATPSKALSKCEPRRFKTTPKESFKYQENKIIDCFESGDEGSLLKPAHEFKLFTRAVQTSDFMKKFCREVLIFACACINSRTNGTIHFGIADENQEKGSVYGLLPRQIVGFPVSDPVQYKDMLTESVNNCFSGEDREFARRCICPLEFVGVESSSACASVNYVIEVDIEASFQYTHDKLFSLDLTPLTEMRKKNVFQYFKRDGSQSSLISEKQLDSFRKDLNRIDARRKQEETEQGKKLQNMTRQMQNLLEVDCGELDETFNRILVLSETCVDTSEPTAEYLKRASVLSNIQWSFILDFNFATKTELGLCQTVARNMDLEIHNVEDFNKDKLMRNGISPSWVFCNGLGDKGLAEPWRKWQISPRARGLDNLIKKASNEYAENRTVILFIIQPEFTKLEALTYGMFLRHFGENAVGCYIEDHRTEMAWKRYVVDELEYIDEHKLSSRGILGLPWEEFTEEIQNLTTHSESGTLKIPLNGNTLCTVESEHFKDKSVLIMNSEECDYLGDMLHQNKERFDQERRESEIRFYKGEEVTMKNLWFTYNGYKQVIERDALKKLRECFDHFLSINPHSSTGVETMKLLNARGSGGTTVALQFLWTLCHCGAPYMARCCAVNSIEDDTSSTIYNFSKFRNSSNLTTVVLVDDVHETEFQRLVKELSEKVKGVELNNIPFILLKVEPSTHPKEAVRDCDRRGCTFLDYKLSKSELRFFNGKYDEMERNHGDGFAEFADGHLLAFMMLMQNSEENRKCYAERIVESALIGLNDNERAVLKFLSLICLSVPDNTYMYIASFDPIMTSVTFRREGIHFNWTKSVSVNAEMFLRFKDLGISTNTSIKKERAVAVMFREFAEAIISWAYTHEEKTIGDIALDLMNCDAFLHGSGIQQNEEFIGYLYYKIYLALQGKKKQTHGSKREIFSRLISRILEKDNCVSKVHLDKAIDVMKLGYERLDHPVLAQQVARLSYIHGFTIKEESENYFTLAIEWVQEALSKQKKDSYFLDTAGRIRLSKLKATFPKVRGSRHGRLDRAEDCATALELCLETIKWFQDSQRAEQTSYSINTAGYYGEIQTMEFFLSILSNSVVFEYNPENLRKYLCLPNWMPGPLPWTAGQNTILKGLRERYITCLGRIEEIQSIIKTEDEIDTYKLNVPFRQFFVLCDPDQPSDDLAKWTQNQMCIQNHIGGSIFKNAFNIHHTKKRKLEDPDNPRDLIQIRQKLEDNFSLDVEETVKDEDMLLMICIKIASYSPFRKPSLPKHLAIEELLETKDNMNALLQKQERINGRFESYCTLFSFMLQWPHDNPDIPLDKNWRNQYDETLKKLETISEAMRWKYKNSSTERDLGGREEFCRRQRLERVPKNCSVTTLFYLGNGQGLDQYVHVNELSHPEDQRGRAINWEHPNIAKRLKRLSGKRIGQNSIKVNTADGNTIHIAVATQWQDKYSVEDVYFYLGFTWRGPLAYYVKEVCKAGTHDIEG